ncbi:MAG: diguanylate cyclase, partial [Actinobacteria bacterium]|nr:diguanylate cyclase [Actinomycetota bacterium]
WWKQSEKETAFFIADRGPGISEENKAKIFDRFYEVEGLLNHSLPGLGLGLYIAKTIIDAHGGGISVDERQGGGSVFRFTVPSGSTENN